MAGLLSILPDWLVLHAPALIVVVPILAAPLVTVFSSGRAAWLVAYLASFVSLLCALIILAQTMSGVVIEYEMGGWPSPYGIVYRIDAIGGAIAALVAMMGFLTFAFGQVSIARDIETRKLPLFYAAFLVCFSGLLGCVTTGDAFNLFVFLEISSLSTYVLVSAGWREDRRALTAAYNYLILGTIGATFFVIGVGFLYIATGTLNMVDIALRIEELGVNRVVEAGFAFIIVGLGLKLAMFPLHTWLPGAYTFAPNVVTAFLAATATKVAYYALIRFLYTVFGPDYAFQGQTLLWLFMPLGVIGMLVGSFQAIFQNNVKRLLALSSVAQVGYMVLGLSFGTAAGLAAGVLHAINHAMMKGALFMALAVFALQVGCRCVQDFRGLGKVMPISMGAFTLAGLSLIGVPLTAGFVSKWYLMNAALERGWWPAALAIVVSSILAVIYVGRILEKAYMHEPPRNADGKPLVAGRVSLSMMAVLLLLAGANVWFGIDASLTTSLACNAASSFFPEAVAATCLSGGRP
jgi:multicomponent Na+:H+ antiporter subunit D